MTEETLYDLRCYVSNCFNRRCSRTSGYMRLTELMIEEYDLSDNDVDEVVGDLEKMVAMYIMENSPKFTDDDE